MKIKAITSIKLIKKSFIDFSLSLDYAQFQNDAKEISGQIVDAVYKIQDERKFDKFMVNKINELFIKNPKFAKVGANDDGTHNLNNDNIQRAISLVRGYIATTNNPDVNVIVRDMFDNTILDKIKLTNWID